MDRLHPRALRAAADQRAHAALRTQRLAAAFLVFHAVFGSLMFLAADAANGTPYAETRARAARVPVCFTVALTAFVVAQGHAAKRARCHGV